MRQTLLLLCTLTLSLLIVGSATAAEGPQLSLSDVLGALQGEFTVPPEWSGIWSITDSTFLCSGQFLFADPGLDTLCAGMMIEFSDPEDPYSVQCAGTVTASTVDVTCTGSGEDPPGCMLTVTIETDATRTGDDYVSEMIITIDASPEGQDCMSGCLRTKTVGTRIGPEPAAYCATVQVEPSSWGQLKSIYR